MNSIIYIFKCCCGPLGCPMFCLRPIRESLTTRIMYSIMLILVFILLTLSHENIIIKLFSNEFNETFNSTCMLLRAESNCQRLQGYKAIYRIAYAFSIFHSSMALFCICISNSQGFRARIHNGFWFLKIIVIFALWVALYLIPIFEKIIFITTIIGLGAAFIFIILQHVSLIDGAYELNGYLRSKGSNNCCYIVMIYVLSFLLYAATAGAYVLIYLQIASPDYCSVNRGCIIVNVIASIVLFLLSLCVKKYIQCKLYIPGAVISIFVAFLTWTALSSAPNVEITMEKFVNTSQTNTTLKEEDDPIFLSCSIETSIFKIHIHEDLHTYLGIAIMLISSVYSSIKSTVEYKRYGIKPSRSKMFSAPQLNIDHMGIKIQEFKKRPERQISTDVNMAESVRTEVTENLGNSVSLSNIRDGNRINLQDSECNITGSNQIFFQSGLVGSHSEPNVVLGTKCSETNVTKPLEVTPEDLLNYNDFLIHDEFKAVRYSYSWLHFIFALAYLFVMVQLTNWYSPETSNLRQLSGTWPSFWMKLITSWVALALFGWTILSPAFCIGRKLYEYPIDSVKRFAMNKLQSMK